MNPKVIEAAEVTSAISDSAKLRARRVLLAQAECLSDEAVDAAISALYPSYFPKSLTEPWRDNLRAAIAAALRFEAGE
jgi:hypothetical protein